MEREGERRTAALRTSLTVARQPVACAAEAMKHHVIHSQWRPDPVVLTEKAEALLSAATSCKVCVSMSALSDTLQLLFWSYRQVLMG